MMLGNHCSPWCHLHARNFFWPVHSLPAATPFWDKRRMGFFANSRKNWAHAGIVLLSLLLLLLFHSCMGIVRSFFREASFWLWRRIFVWPFSHLANCPPPPICHLTPRWYMLSFWAVLAFFKAVWTTNPWPKMIQVGHALSNKQNGVKKVRMNRISNKAYRNKVWRLRWFFFNSNFVLACSDKTWPTCILFLFWPKFVILSCLQLCMVVCG